MLPAVAASAGADTRFLREARAAAAAQARPHRQHLPGRRGDRGVPFLAMEFLKGEPLDERLNRDAKLPLAEVLRIGREMAEGLAAAHDHGPDPPRHQAGQRLAGETALQASRSSTSAWPVPPHRSPRSHDFRSKT